MTEKKLQIKYKNCSFTFTYCCFGIGKLMFYVNINIIFTYVKKICSLTVAKKPTSRTILYCDAVHKKFSIAPVLVSRNWLAITGAVMAIMNIEYCASTGKAFSSPYSTSTGAVLIASIEPVSGSTGVVPSPLWKSGRA